VTEREARASKAYRERHPDRAALTRRTQKLKHLYGLSRDEFDTLLASQEGRCAICGVVLDRSSKGLEPAIDHNHDTTKVRGVLCAACNTGLGGFRDSPILLTLALAYLRRTDGDGK
jgi:hypothetical protein